MADDAIMRALREDLTIDFPTTQALVAWLMEQGRDMAPWQLQALRDERIDYAPRLTLAFIPPIGSIPSNEMRITATPWGGLALALVMDPLPTPSIVAGWRRQVRASST